MSDEEVVAALRAQHGVRTTAPLRGAGQTADYDGRLGEVAGIALTNTLLGILTLGFYRFWGKTRLRRYLWGRVSFGGDSFEYTGTGMELFVGFLVAIAFLIPLGALASLVELVIPANEVALAANGVIQAAVIIYLIQFAIFRARRYRLTRTQWRGIRGGQSGSALAYAVAGLVWTLATALTLGLAYPVMRTRLQRYRTDNTWFGSERFAFSGRAAPMFGRWLIAWLLLVPTLGVSYAWYRAAEFRYFTANTRYAGLSFESDLATARVVWIWLRYMAILIVLFALVMGLAAVLFPGLLEVATEEFMTGGDATAMESAGPLFLLVPIVALFVWLLIAGVARVAVYLHPMLAAICGSLTIRGEADFDAIRQSQLARPGRGEGFADALDVGSI